MAVTQESPQQLNIRAPKSLIEKCKQLAAERGESLQAFLARELDDYFSGRKLSQLPVSDDDLERVFCLWYARKYDVTEVESLKEIARFRGRSILDVIGGHIHGGLQDAYFME